MLSINYILLAKLVEDLFVDFFNLVAEVINHFFIDRSHHFLPRVRILAVASAEEKDFI